MDPEFSIIIQDSFKQERLFAKWIVMITMDPLPQMAQGESGVMDRGGTLEP